MNDNIERGVLLLGRVAKRVQTEVESQEDFHGKNHEVNLMQAIMDDIYSFKLKIDRKLQTERRQNGEIA